MLERGSQSLRLFPFFFLATFFVFVLAASPVQATVYFYVDPDWSGAETGAASKPWSKLDQSAWQEVDSALANDDVVIYFSAREAGSDVNEKSTEKLRILRMNMSNHRVTLDGSSKYNANDANPTWENYSGSSRFEIKTSGPITTANNDAPYDPRINVTVRGFRVISTGGQGASLAVCDNMVLEDNEFSHTSSAKSGPGIILTVRGDHEVFSNNVTIRNNIVHDTYGEGIYIAGSSSANRSAHNGVLLENNVVYDVAVWGGEPDGIDIKDGHQNVVVRGNVVYRTTPGTGRDCITTNSGALIEKNFVYGCGRNGITLGSFWSTYKTRSGSIVRNNIAYKTGGNNKYGWDSGIRVTGQPDPTADNWENTQVYNNTVYGVRGEGIWISQYAVGSVVSNNIVFGNDAEALEVEKDILALHSNNLFAGSSGNLVKIGKETYTSSNLASFELTAINQDPQFVGGDFSSDPASFSLSQNSPALAQGTVIPSFSDDFFGVDRGLTWDMGAIQSNDGSSGGGGGGGTPPPPTAQAPTAPTGLSVTIPN